jgi:hypothetical protein
MAYIDQSIEARKLGKAIGSGQCVALVQAWCGTPNTGSWREGVKVRGNDHLIQKGTAIATFEDGQYANRSSGNHAAIYMGQNETGIQVIDQWSGQAPHRRTIRWEGRGVSNDGDYFSVIE